MRPEGEVVGDEVQPLEPLKPHLTRASRHSGHDQHRDIVRSVGHLLRGEHRLPAQTDLGDGGSKKIRTDLLPQTGHFNLDSSWSMGNDTPRVQTSVAMSRSIIAAQSSVYRWLCVPLVAMTHRARTRQP